MVVKVLCLGIVVVFGTVLGGMTSILSNADTERSVFSHKYNSFLNETVSVRYLIEYKLIYLLKKRLGIDKTSKKLCLNYFDFIWSRWGGNNIYQNGMFQLLSHPLKAEFNQSTFQRLINKVIKFVSD